MGKMPDPAKGLSHFRKCRLLSETEHFFCPLCIEILFFARFFAVGSVLIIVGAGALIVPIIAVAAMVKRFGAGAFFLEHIDLGSAFCQTAIDLDLGAVGGQPGVIHHPADSHGQGDVILYLLRTPVVLIEKIIHRFHLFIGATREV